MVLIDNRVLIRFLVCFSVSVFRCFLSVCNSVCMLLDTRRSSVRPCVRPLPPPTSDATDPNRTNERTNCCWPPTENYHGSNTVFLVITLMSVVGGVFIVFAMMALCYRSVVVHKNFSLCLRLVCRWNNR